MKAQQITLNRELYDQADAHTPKYRAKPGLNEEIVRLISKSKNEPEWMLQKRLQGLRFFQQTPLPNWGPSLQGLDFSQIVFFVDPNAKETNTWEEVPEEIKRTFDRLGIPEAEKKALAGVGAQYDCLTQDTIIPTNPRGMIEIKNIKEGDRVFAWDEKTNKIVKAKVRGILDKGDLPVFEIKVRGKSIKATYNHPFLTLVDRRKSGKKRARYNPEWRYLHALKRGDIIAIATDLPDFGESHKFLPIKYKQKVIGRNQFSVKYDLSIEHCYSEVKFPKESNKDLMWLFGFYLGDGYITKDKKKDKMRLHFAIPDNQIELKEKVKEVIKRYFGYTIRTEDKFRISINSTKIALFFKENGFYGKAYTKKLPSWINTIPKEQKLSLIAGYIDSDGTVRKKEKDAVITSVNYDLLQQIKELCVYCGYDTSKITTFKSKDVTNEKIFRIGHRLQITGKTKDLPCVHPIKKQRLLSRITGFGKHNSIHGTTIRKYCSDNVGFSKIEDIKYIGKERTYDLEVENYHNFVANGIIVHNSSVVYHSLLQSLKDKGVIFENMDVAVQKYPDLVKKHFMNSCIPANDHKFIMLHAAVWSGGTFIYVPPHVKVDLPLQAYFRMNEQRGGQFEHTLIILDEGAELHYIEGCSSPRYSSTSLHAGCVEIFVSRGAKMRYSSIENWSKNVYNLNTKRALVDADATMEWVSGNMGSCVTMLYPCSVLRGERAKADNFSIVFAGKEQHQDVGAKAIHVAPHTSSTIVSKSISKDGGISSYRGLVKIMPQARGSTTSVVCDALILDEHSRSHTDPILKIENNDVDAAHEAKVGKLSEEALFYLQSRGLSEEQAVRMIVSGFVGPIVRQLPLEYAVELNKLIELEMEGAVG